MAPSSKVSRNGAGGCRTAGFPPPHDASGHTWHHRDDLLVAITREGMKPPWAPDGYQSDMPAFGGVLGDDEIGAVLAYIQSTWPDEVREQRKRMLEQQTRR